MKIKYETEVTCCSDCPYFYTWNIMSAKICECKAGANLSDLICGHEDREISKNCPFKVDKD